MSDLSERPRNGKAMPESGETPEDAAAKTAAERRRALDAHNEAWDNGAWNSRHDDEPVKPISYTETERAEQRQRAMRGLLRTVRVQFLVGLAVAVIAFAVSGSTAGVSALLGAAAYIFPNALFAFKLILSVHKPGGATPATFFLGQFLKIAFAGLLVVAVASLGREFLVWPAFLAGLVCALKSQWLVLAFGAKDL